MAQQSGVALLLPRSFHARGAGEAPGCQVRYWGAHQAALRTEFDQNATSDGRRELAVSQCGLLSVALCEQQCCGRGLQSSLRSKIRWQRLLRQWLWPPASQIGPLLVLHPRRGVRKTLHIQLQDAADAGWSRGRSRSRSRNGSSGLPKTTDYRLPHFWVADRRSAATPSSTVRRHGARQRRHVLSVRQRSRRRCRTSFHVVVLVAAHCPAAAANGRSISVSATWPESICARGAAVNCEYEVQTCRMSMLNVDVDVDVDVDTSTCPSSSSSVCATCLSFATPLCCMFVFRALIESVFYWHYRIPSQVLSVYGMILLHLLYIFGLYF